MSHLTLPLPTLPAPVAVASVDWQPRLGAPGEIAEGFDDVVQCVRTILHTPKGSIPLAPDFGCDLFLYLDQPVTVARPQIVRAVVDALALLEARVEVTRVALIIGDPANVASGALSVNVECRVVGTEQTFVTVVAPRSAA